MERARILEMEEEHRLTAEAQAAADGNPCRCPQPNPRAAKLGPYDPTAHCRPRTWLLDRGAPTCAHCRLRIADWETRFPGLVATVAEFKARLRTTASDAA